MSEKLNFNDKTENNGTNDRGRLTAAEFNQVVNAVNDHSEALGGLKLKTIEGEAAFEQLDIKESDTVYLIFDD